LKTSREIITKIRIEQKILNSRERNTDRLKKDIGIILKEEGKISNRKLTKKADGSYAFFTMSVFEDAYAANKSYFEGIAGSYTAAQ